MFFCCCFFSGSRGHRDLHVRTHSFPTRRSSYLKACLFVTHDLEEAIALADRVVVMSAGPAAGIVGDYRVSLERPRDIAEIRTEAAFHDIHKAIWATLRVEVQKAYMQGEDAQEDRKSKRLNSSN